MINFDFDEKVVLVTAASKGIGFAIAKNFYLAGASVAICSRDRQTLLKSIKQISGNNKDRIVGYSCDLSNLAECGKLVDKVKSHFKSNIDILTIYTVPISRYNKPLNWTRWKVFDPKLFQSFGHRAASFPCTKNYSSSFWRTVL